MQNGQTTPKATTHSHTSKSETFAMPKESGILLASWLEIAPGLLKEIEHAPAIFLLNPFGQTLFTYDDLALLYQRTSAPTELCLLISHKQCELYVTAAARSAAQSTALPPCYVQIVGKPCCPQRRTLHSRSRTCCIYCKPQFASTFYG